MRSGPPTSVPLFTKALESDNKVMRASAAEGLARTADPRVLPELEKAVTAERDTEAKLAIGFAITALGKLDCYPLKSPGIISRNA